MSLFIVRDCSLFMGDQGEGLDILRGPLFFGMKTL